MGWPHQAQSFAPSGSRGVVVSVMAPDRTRRVLWRGEWRCRFNLSVTRFNPSAAFLEYGTRQKCQRCPAAPRSNAARQRPPGARRARPPSPRTSPTLAVRLRDDVRRRPPGARARVARGVPPYGNPPSDRQAASKVPEVYDHRPPRHRRPTRPGQPTTATFTRHRSPTPMHHDPPAPVDKINTGTPLAFTTAQAALLRTSVQNTPRHSQRVGA
jgi:hypothetical protein